MITSLQRGGAETHLAQLLEQLAPKGKHAVIFFKDGPVRSRIEQIGIPCYHITALGGYANPLFFIRLWRLIRTLNPYCVHTNLWAANLAGRIIGYFLKIPCIAVLHAQPWHEGILRAFIDNIIPCTPTLYVCVAHSITQVAQKSSRYQGTSLITIRNGISSTYVQHAAQRLPYHPIMSTLKQKNSFIIGTVGRLVSVKNYDFLIQVLAQLYKCYPHIQLVIIGSGDQEFKLRQLAQNLAIEQKIHFLGAVVAYPYYQHFDCFVQPSHSEGLSIALLEALCFEIPVVVSSKNKEHECITDGVNGLIIDPQDQTDAYRALEQLIRDAQLRKRLGAAGLKTVREQFSIEHTATHYRELFEACTKEQ